MNDKLYSEHSCSCDKCKNMCKETPCLGTPEEMIRIAKAGFSHKLAESYWAVGVMNGTHSELVPIIAPLIVENKGCAFLTEEGLCELHDLGLKPYEGRMTNAHQAHIINKKEELKQVPAYIVIDEWLSKDYNNVKRRIFKYGK